MPSPATEAYEFGPYRIDSGERLLHRGDALISLPPKVASTLLVLVQNAGRMVDKDALMKAVWPDTFVEEGALTRNISLLRKTLGDAGEVPEFIETIPKRGYRFIAPVHILVPGNGNGLAIPEQEADGPMAWPQPVAMPPARSWMPITIGILLLLIGFGAIARYATRNSGVATDIRVPHLPSSWPSCRSAAWQSKARRIRSPKG